MGRLPPPDRNVLPVISSPAKFDEELAAILKDHEVVYAWFFGSETAANEQSWCLECVTSDPWILSASRQAAFDGKPVTLVQARVGTKEEWEDPEHPYRKMTKSIPAVLKFVRGKDGPQARIDRFRDLTNLGPLKSFFES